MRGLLFLAAAALASAAVATPIKRAVHPTLSPDGSQLVFSWQNDLWIVSAKGGEARRLTIHPANDMMPRWFPDGSRIGFVSNRFGNNDLFSMRPDGSDIRRHSFESSNESLYSISPDGKMLLGYTNAWGRLNMFGVPASGGEMIRMSLHPLELSYFPTMSPDGKRVAYVINGSAGSWRNPTRSGSDTGEIWIGDTGAPIVNNRQLTRNDANDMFPMFAEEDSIVFVSNRGGKPDLWRMKSDGSQARKITDLGGGTVRWPSINANGRFVAFEYDSDLYTLDLRSGRPQKVLIEAPEDQVVNPVETITLNQGANGLAVSPDGKRAVVSVRGDIFLIPERGGTTRQLTRHPGNDFSPVWLDNRRVLFVSGRNAKRELMTVDLDGKESVFLSQAEDLTHPTVSPDRKWIAFHRADREVVVMPITGGQPRVLATGGFADVHRGESLYSWSPDSKFIAFTSQTERGANVNLVEVESGEVTRIARVARSAGIPLFLPNGRGVFFGASHFGTPEVMIVDLVAQDVTFSEDDLDAIDAERPKPGPVEVKFDLRNIEDRMRRLTSDGGDPLLASPDSRTIWANVGGQLSAVPVSGGPATPVQGVTGFVTSLALGANNQKVYALASGRPAAINLANGSVSPIPFSAQMTIDRRAEEQALFTEIWWAFDRMYYDPGLHGRNWQAIKDEYRALVPFTFDRQDFYALITEMVEELDSSHLSVAAPPSGVTLPDESTAFLGVEWNWSKLMTAGVYEVASVLPNSPADHPQTQLMPGDVVKSINGTALGRGTTVAELLRNQVGRRVRLSVQRGENTVEIAVRAGSPALAGSLRYEAFIAERRAEVERLSNGRLTYFHIQGMNAPSTDRLFRDMRVYAEGKQGAVIDVRWNGGGNTANRILSALRLDEPWLNRRFRAFPNWTMSEELFRGEAAEMPVALLTNQFSYSNAEIFSEGWRQMKLGPIVGEPTGGNVITVAGNFGLWDGGGVQIPFIGIFTKNGEPLERIGRRVDFLVPYNPNAWIAGRDVQIEKAVEELLKRAR